MKWWFLLPLAAAAGFFISYLSGYAVIPWMHKLKFGQTILDIGPRWHKNKQGTPTMGGIMFMAGSIGAFILALITDKLSGGGILEEGVFNPSEMKIKLTGGILMAVGYAIVGFADDYVKVVKKRNKGLTIMQKSLAQILIITAYLTTLYNAGFTYIQVPFYGTVKTGMFFWILGVAVMYCTVNAANFTDGVDGLCGSVTLVMAISFTVIAIMRNMFGLSVLTAALAGSLAGYLIWNWNPSKIIMGDLGSHYLGGMVVAVSYTLDAPWLILMVGAVYVFEFVTDVMQIGYFRLTHGKRIFKMAPIHHHFEMSGWSEKKIVYVFTSAGIIGGAAAVALVYLGLK
ncbi:MAG: phospho-N-acetylmuramoyl-pentapeptide-transferase [Oscillospiraceae bacterium]|nr:phospho-N-acetylmuramoyl-pentapeptide-transferase [Oscillospiraceae bacterium]